jgi:predicted TIM-barrel fold metal-dependent hydrolase
MLPADARLISVDDHLLEHPGVWQDRLPARYREAGPRVVEQPPGEPWAGHEVWLMEGRAYPTMKHYAMAGQDPEGESGPIRFSEMIPGCYDPAARCKDMDLDGVWAQLCFPSFARFAGTRFLECRDRDLALLCVQAYNDFVIDEWCGFDPRRQIPLVLLPLWDVAASVAEVERTASRGAKAVSFPENPAPLGLATWHSRAWDPVLAAVEEAGLPLCMHFGTSGQMTGTSDDCPDSVRYTLLACNSMGLAADLLLSGVFVRFPRLRVALSEGGIGWMPYFLERIDYTWEGHRRMEPATDFGVRPSEMFAGHVYGCFIDDEVGLDQRHRIGVGQILWESDYPHTDSAWPHSRERLAQRVQGIPDDEVRQMVETNAADLFGLAVGAA